MNIITLPTRLVPQDSNLTFEVIGLPGSDRRYTVNRGNEVVYTTLGGTAKVQFYGVVQISGQTKGSASISDGKLNSIEWEKS